MIRLKALLHYQLALTATAFGYLACSPSNEGNSPSGSGGAAVVPSGGATGTGSSPGSGGSTSGGGGSVAESGGADGSGGETPGSGGETPGSGGAGEAELGPIMRSASSYVLEFSDYLFEVDPTQAGIITTFSLSQTNILTPVEFKNSFLNGGSQFWIAPQDDSWGWPPPVEMDSAAHTVVLDGTTFTTTSPAFELSQTNNTVSIVKSYAPNLSEGAIDMTFTIKNTGPAVAKQSPWQITRVLRDGITFWPKGDGSCGEVGDVPVIPVTDGVYFWNDKTLGAGLTNNKFSCDGSGGWIAHVSGTLLLIKTWTDVPAASQHATDKEIQLYFGAGYEEVEMRGPYADIAAGGTSTPWAVRWYLRPAPTDLSEASLLAAVTAVIE